jgi:hypothetical protein
MNTILPMLLCAVVFVGGAIFFAQFLGPLIMSYKITDSSFEVRLFSVIPESKTHFNGLCGISLWQPARW